MDQSFCNVVKGKPLPVDNRESLHVAEAVKEMGLRHLVITYVTHDDLEDGGAAQFAETIEKIRGILPKLS